MKLPAPRNTRFSSRTTQRGAALFVSLMILIIITLLALSASQVTSLQERMSSIYRSDALAFEAAESRVRADESSIISTNPLLCDYAPNPLLPEGWLDTSAGVAASRMENLNLTQSDFSRGLPDYLGSTAVGQSRSPGSINCLFFRVSAYEVDDAANVSSRALIQTTYTP